MALTKVTSGVRTIASSEVVTASIADDAITLAKMAPGTDGNLITYDTSGNPAHVATGSSGQVLTSQGAGAAPVFATPASGLPAATFTSSEQTVAVDTVLDVPHGLGAIPSLVQVRLRCKTADVGYAVNDEIVVSSGPVDLVNDRGWTVQTDATNVTILQGTGIPVINQTTLNGSNITVGSWRWIVKAWS